MNRRSKQVSMLAGTAAAGIMLAWVGAPSAVATPGQDCSNGGGTVVCQTPGNAEVYPDQPTAPDAGVGSNGPYGPWGNVPPLG
ncbi:hypothetical protein [Mycobacterium sp. DBP42]|uniref:hypothetical protein n=1 Tax=Mycobacterium sp. DBP42 TaxID=2545267 RepID=UPI001041FD4B|nr:hypothetical protein [Mycobacterium sp. DBP42]TMS55056.1 hypothetical protein E0T84_05810 [Mycobacterium sp. DBP42]